MCGLWAMIDWSSWQTRPQALSQDSSKSWSPGVLKFGVAPRVALIFSQCISILKYVTFISTWITISNYIPFISNWIYSNFFYSKSKTASHYLPPLRLLLLSSILLFTNLNLFFSLQLCILSLFAFTLRDCRHLNCFAVTTKTTSPLVAWWPWITIYKLSLTSSLLVSTWNFIKA